MPAPLGGRPAQREPHGSLHSLDLYPVFFSAMTEYFPFRLWPMVKVSAPSLVGEASGPIRPRPTTHNSAPSSREVRVALVWTRIEVGTAPCVHTLAGTVSVNADLAMGYIWLKTIGCLLLCQMRRNLGHILQGGIWPYFSESETHTPFAPVF